ncbi:MAG: ATP-binding cassette domain-containing protein [Peptococcaceae bacterium]|nr:ATP-binding cassette domain-containing protein [Peptococcaceae bacterium]
MGNVILSARKMSCQVGNRFLLKDINWDIEENSRWVVIGLNGSGKTTLLGALAGYQEYNHGTLSYRGQSYRDLDILQLRKNMGWVSNSFFNKVYHHESAMDLILAGLSGTYGVVPETIGTEEILRIKRLLRSMGLEGKADHAFDKLSMGERQSVLIIRALLTNPQILVFDEPMTGLDVVRKEKMLRYIQRLSEKGQHTMLYVTHHFEEIPAAYFDHCLLLKHGRIFDQGPIDQLMNSATIGAFLEKDVQLRLNDNGYYNLTFSE